MSIVKMPHGYKFRKEDVLLLLRERKEVAKKGHYTRMLREIEYLQKKIRHKRGVIDLSKDEVAKRWLNIFRFWLRPVS